MPLSNIVHLYVVRLKARVILVQEAFVVLGIAVGVALLFASQIASTSLNGSVARMTNGVVGQAKYQLAARSVAGFSEALVGQVRRLPGVYGAIPLLEQQTSISGPAGTRAVDLLATDPHAVKLVGPLLHRFTANQLAHQEALALPQPIARAIGVGQLEEATLQLGGRRVSAVVALELGSRSIGELVDSPVVIAPLAYAQKLLGTPGRISRVFVSPYPGHDAEVQAGLRRLAAGSLNVEPATYDVALFDQAARPINQSTGTFAAICALVGFMFAYCAILLTIDLRRALIKEVRRGGATRLETCKVLLFDALVLGVVASILGLVLGDVLSTLVSPSSVGYLAFAFPVGTQRIVTAQSIAVSVAIGMLAAAVGVVSPARELWRRPATGRLQSAVPTKFGRHSLLWLGGSLICLAVTTVVLFAAPQSAIVGIVTLLVGLLLLLPLVVDASTALFERLYNVGGSAGAIIAVHEIRSPKTRIRSATIAAIAAISVFASVTIQGSHVNLQGGLSQVISQLSTVADVWVQPSGQQDLLATTPLIGQRPLNLSHLHGIRSVQAYRASFLTYDSRRTFVLAPPSTATWPIPPSQLTGGGNLALATARIKAGGWAVVSDAIAQDKHLHVGQPFTLSTPQPITVRLAATATNLGWPPGAIVLNSRDYVRGWGKSTPSAYNVMLSPGASISAVEGEIRRVIGPGTALTVETARERTLRLDAASREGLARLTQIAILVLLAGLLATATSMTAAISQRRRRYARMKVEGYGTRALWEALVWESLILFGGGCAVGAVLGMYGQFLLSHALLTVTGFPVMFSAEALLALGSFAVVTIVGAAIVGISGYRTASIRPYPYRRT
ncbi:MAG: ABC transporter permease [Solirubrobacteraceae bacterium]